MNGVTRSIKREVINWTWALPAYHQHGQLWPGRPLLVYQTPDTTLAHVQ